MIDTTFRDFFSRISLPITILFAKSGISPNFLTFVAFTVSSGASIALVLQKPNYALFLWWCGRFFDSMDGQLARYKGIATPYGAFLDITLDMLAYSSVIVAFSLYYPTFHLYWMIILFLYVGCITSALSLGILMDHANIKNNDNRGLRLATGLAEGGETGIAYTLFLLFPAYLQYLLPLWILILFITVLARLVLANKVSRKT